MAKINLNGITVEEINRNSKSAYAASISSGEIYKVVCRHSKNGNVLLAIDGFALNCKDFNGSTFIADGCILYNPPLTKQIVEACDDSENSIFIVAGAVSKTAPAPSTDTVQSKTNLEKELAEIKNNYFGLKGKEKEAADARMDEIEKLLKTA